MRRHVTLWAAAVSTAIGLLGGGAVGFLLGQSDDDETSDLAAVVSTTTSSTTTTSTSRTSTTATTPPPPTSPPDEIGVEKRSGGAVITVTKASSAPSVRLNQSNVRTGSPGATLTEERAGDGAKFVIVATQVRNDAQRSMDLTCSLPIRAVLYDDRGREFTPIPKLYQLPGNPECNAQLQPGFRAAMTWVFRVPADARVNVFFFEDLTSGFGSSRPPGTAVNIVV